MSRAFLKICLLLIISIGSNAQTFRILGDDDFPPFSFVDERNQLAGIDIDILKELSARLDVDFEIKLVPWKRLLLMTQTGAVFGSFSLFKTDEREKFALFTYPVHYSTYKLFTLSNKTFAFDGVKELYGKRLAIAAGFSVNSELEAAHARGDLTLIEIFSFEDSFRRLLRGGIDALIGNELVVEYQLKQGLKNNAHLGSIEALPNPIQKARGAYFVLSKKHPLKDHYYWQIRIRQALKDIEDEGLMESIVKAYIR